MNEQASERENPDLSTTTKTMILLLENDKYMNEAFELIDQLAHDGADQERGNNVFNTVFLIQSNSS